MLINRILLDVLVVAAALVVVTLVMTPREPDDWLFGGYILSVYLALTGFEWIWKRRRRRE